MTLRINFFSVKRVIIICPLIIGWSVRQSEPFAALMVCNKALRWGCVCACVGGCGRGWPWEVFAGGGDSIEEALNKRDTWAELSKCFHLVGELQSGPKNEQADQMF